MTTDRRRFLAKMAGASSSVLFGGAVLSGRYLQQAQARQSLKREILAKSTPLLNEKESRELATLPRQAQDEVREYFHGVCLNVHSFTEYVCSHRFAEKLSACNRDEAKHELLNTAFSQKVVTGTEVLNRVDAMAHEIGADLDRNWAHVCRQLNDSWKLLLRSAAPPSHDLDLQAVTEETIHSGLEGVRTRAYPLGQRPAASQTAAEIGKTAILLLPVIGANPLLGYPLFLVKALGSAWNYVLGRLAHPAGDYQLAITERLSVLGNRVGAECEQEIRRRIADLHTFQQQAVDVAAMQKINEAIPALI